MAKQRESTRVVDPFVRMLKARGWTIKNFHGNQYQQGVPDAYIMHKDYAPRWVEFKVKEDSGHVHLTDAQEKTFPIWHGHGVPIYVIAAKDLRGSVNQALRERLYNKLFDKPNVLYALEKRMHGMLY